MRIKPLVNYGLIAANVLLFVAGINGSNPEARFVLARFMLQPEVPQLHQFFTCVFLHQSWSHLLGNMLFLWVFGNALNDRLGHLGYLLFYLAGGVIASLGYLVLSPNAPVLGASGAISAVTGAYLVLFPRTTVTLLLWFILITTFHVSSLFFLGLQIVWDFYMSYQTISGSPIGGVAYVAHSSGYIFGIVLASMLLLVRLLPRDGLDLLALARMKHRRQQFQRMVRGGYDPFGRTHPRGRAKPPTSRQVDSRTIEVAQANDSDSGRDLRLRRDIAAALRRGDATTAAGLYREILTVNSEVILPRQQQLDIANQLMTMKQYEPAAEAYERFRRQYGSYEHMADIDLMLGLIYGRYLNQYDKAAELLERAADTLTDERKNAMARHELQDVRRKQGR
jgi:membrane associated rhomboid family serine protease